MLTKEEQIICRNIAIGVRDVVNIKKNQEDKDIEAKTLQLAGEHIKSIIDNDPGCNHRTIRELQRKYSPGACVLAFQSVQNFARKKCTNVYASFIPKDWCFESGAFFAHSAAWPDFGIKRATLSDAEAKHKYICIVVVYHDWPKSKLFWSFPLLKFNEEDIRKYFQRKRLSASVLRKRYPQFLHSFQYVAKQGIAVMSNAKLRSISLQDAANELIPDRIADCVDSVRDQKVIEKIKRDLFIECMHHNAEWLEWVCQINNDTSFVHITQRTLLLFDKFPFIYTRIMRIANIVGEDTFSFALSKEVEQCEHWRKHIDLQHLIAKIEGRKCSFADCRNQESRHNGVIEKYKTCSACRNAFYCSRSCQKRDWNTGCHKAACKYGKYGLQFDLASRE